MPSEASSDLLQFRLEGAYRISAVDSVTGKERLLVDWFDNLITNAGLNYLMTSSADPFLYGSVGTGSTAASVSDTALQTKVAHSNTLATADVTVGQTSVSPYYIQRTRVFQFAVGAATGVLREVGAGWDGTLLFSRSLIKDGSGDPISIEVLPTESLSVAYRLRSYPPMVDSAYAVTLSGIDYTVTRRAANVSASTGSWAQALAGLGLPESGSCTLYGATGASLGPVTGAPAGTPNATPTVTFAWSGAYVADSFSRTFTLTLQTANGNLAGGIKNLLLAGAKFPYMQYSFTPVLPKDATNQLILNLQMTWARA